MGPTLMAKPNPDVVRILMSAMLDSLLKVNQTYTVSELISASFNMCDVLVADLVKDPNVNPEPIRLALAAMYARLPAETVN